MEAYLSRLADLVARHAALEIARQIEALAGVAELQGMDLAISPSQPAAEGGTITLTHQLMAVTPGERAPPGWMVYRFDEGVA